MAAVITGLASCVASTAANEPFRDVPMAVRAATTMTAGACVVMISLARRYQGKT